MQYLVICLQWLTEMHSGTFILEMDYGSMYHSTLLPAAAVWMFVIFNAIVRGLAVRINRGVWTWKTY